MKHFLDITKYTCPMTFVKVKLQLSKMEKGEQLEILLNGGEPLENVPRSAKEQGHKVISIDPVENSHHKVVLEK